MEDQFVYGIAGIMQLFHCSRSKAFALKKTTIAPAVYQTGRKIMTDWREALALVKAAETKK